MAPRDRWRFLTVLVVASAACQEASAPSKTEADPAKVEMRFNQADSNRYIVMLHPVGDAHAEGVRLTRLHGGRLRHTFDRGSQGFSAELIPSEAERLKRNPAVRYIERVRPMSLFGTQTPTPSWGLDRIDQPGLPLNNIFNYPSTGTGVRVYIIDTGIFSLSDFGGRLATGFTAYPPGGTTDCFGHGTHVAGTAGGTVYGVAKGVTLVPVRVSGSACDDMTNESILLGMNWVLANAIRPAVANLSLGGPVSQAIDDKVRDLTNAGIVVVAAAGNFGSDACAFSPARVSEAITVAATDASDVRGTFPSGNRSNYGTCVDLFAPGVAIVSDWHVSPFVNTVSGTSMAAPHVAGAAALYLAAYPTATPAQVSQALVANATSGMVQDPGTGSPNKLLYTGFIPAPLLSPSALSASGITATTATITWANGSPSASTVIQRRPVGQTTWNSGGTALPGATSIGLTTLTACTRYDVQAYHQSGSQTGPVALSPALVWTTAVAGQICGPFDFQVVACQPSVVSGKTYLTYSTAWTNWLPQGKQFWEILENTSSNPATATVIFSGQQQTATQGLGPYLSSHGGSGSRYFWIRHRVGTTFSPPMPLNDNPLVPANGCQV